MPFVILENMNIQGCEADIFIWGMCVCFMTTGKSSL